MSSRHVPPRPSIAVDVQGLPPTLTLEQAAALIGCGRTLAYDLARRGEFPCRVLRLGRKYVIPTADLLHALGLTPDAQAQASQATRLAGGGNGALAA